MKKNRKLVVRDASYADKDLADLVYAMHISLNALCYALGKSDAIDAELLCRHMLEGAQAFCARHGLSVPSALIAHTALLREGARDKAKGRAP